MPSHIQIDNGDSFGDCHAIAQTLVNFNHLKQPTNWELTFGSIQWQVVLPTYRALELLAIYLQIIISETVGRLEAGHPKRPGIEGSQLELGSAVGSIAEAPLQILVVRHPKVVKMY